MNNEIKISIDFMIDNNTYKIKSVPAFKKEMLSIFIKEQQTWISKYMKSSQLLSFEISTASFNRIATIDEKEIYLYIEDISMEDFKLNGFRKLKFYDIGCSVEEFIKGENDFNDDMDEIHELIE